MIKKSYKLKSIPPAKNMPTISDIKSFKFDWKNKAKVIDQNKDNQEKRRKLYQPSGCNLLFSTMLISNFFFNFNSKETIFEKQYMQCISDIDRFGKIHRPAESM